MENIRKLSAAITAVLTAASAITLLPRNVFAQDQSGASCSFELPAIVNYNGGDSEPDMDIMLAQDFSFMTTAVDLSGRAAELPTYYSMRDEGLCTTVKDQSPFGTCWTFSSAASAESSLLERIPSIDISEMHTAFYVHYGDSSYYIPSSDPSLSLLDWGGNSFAAANLWANRHGALSEKTLPYLESSLFNDLNYTEPNDSAARKYKDMSEYLLRNAYLFDYNDAGTNRYEVNELVKQFVYDGRAVDISYCTAGHDNYSNSCYSDKGTEKADHSVTIVGWDDNFTASPFIGHKGAWLIKNSWGTSFCDDGYFWLFYDDSSICEFAVFDMMLSEELMQCYYHDSTFPVQSLCADDNDIINKPSYGANIFRAEHTEQIEAVSTYISKPNTEYEVTVYTDLKDANDPTSGTPTGKKTVGSSALTGYITIDLESDVAVEAGELFSVVVSYYCGSNKFVIPVESCTYLEDKDSGMLCREIGGFVSYDQIVELTGSGESFYSEDGAYWSDLSDEEYEYSEEEKNAFLKKLADRNQLDDMTYDEIVNKYSQYVLKVKPGNISIKAFSNPVDTVDFSHASGNVGLDERVGLSVRDGRTVYYSINGGELCEYTEPIEITETCEISATVDGENFTTRKYEPAYAEFVSIMFNLQEYGSTRRNYPTAERIDAHTYELNVDGSVEEIQIYPISSAEIRFDGEQLATNKLTDSIPLSFGKNEFVFRLRDENKLENEVTLTVKRGLGDFDYENETVIFNEVTSLTAPDGHVFSDGESVSDYIGQTLKAVVDGREYELEVPSRAELPELETDTMNETLNFVLNEIAKRLEVKTYGSSTYQSALPRCIDGEHINSGMVMNKAVRVIAGETIYLRVAAGNGEFASEPVRYSFDAPKSAPKVLPKYNYVGGKYTLEYSETLEYGRINESVTVDDVNQLAKEYGYDYDTFVQIMLQRYGAESEEELLKALAIEWDSVFEYETEKPSIAVRSYSDSESFASQIKYVELEPIRRGDVNFDGAVDAIDASRVLAHYAAVSTKKPTSFTEEQKTAGDYNYDGVADAVDASLILSYYAKVSTGGKPII